MTQVKNPYVFKIKGKLVRMSFSENRPTSDECLTRVLENLYRYNKESILGGIKIW